ncbi:MAG: gamma-glutamyltransferase family protein [Proteobacteria bacterium]|nr:gamma-glutamyltransferase family protein [Pseudomonadota bacterium]MBI3505765.1 gamma-glutamyltransferase family protein [Pseudomonadota bacterium]
MALRSGSVATLRRPFAAEAGVVAAGHQDVADVGAEILKRGGNVVDAIVAAAFASFVVEPASCGIGGHGRLSIHQAGSGRTIGIDHFVRAPAQATPEMYQAALRGGSALGRDDSEGAINATGHLSVGIPGAIAGLTEAHRRFGSLPWAELLQPAIALARAGLPVDARLALHILGRAAELSDYPAAAAWLMPGGLPPRPASFGEIFARLDGSAMTDTLDVLARKGGEAFYKGAIARAIEREMEANGGLLSADDLACYRPHVFIAPNHSYRRWRYVTGGDLIAVETLNILEQFDLAGLGADSAGYRHLMAEAMAQAFVDNFAHAGDPFHVSSPLDGLASKAYAAGIAGTISLDRARQQIRPGDPWAQQGSSTGTKPLPEFEGTTQICVADRRGDMASLITSLGSAFGSLVMVPGTGILLGNAMQWFDPRPGRANSVGPGRMPLYAAPVLLAFAGERAIAALAASGGYRIQTAVLHGLVNRLDHAMEPQAALEAPRVHAAGDGVDVDARIEAAVIHELEVMGHRLRPIDAQGLRGGFGRPSAVWRDERGLLHAASDPSAGGVAGF